MSHPSHLADPKRTAPLRTVHEALSSLGVDALISIGGDDTLKTANKFKMFQDYLPAEPEADRRRPRAQDDRQRLPGHRLHLRLLHGRRDPGQRDPQPAGRRRGEPRATSSPRRMGRSAGWLAYGAAIAGEASLVISVEDIDGELSTEETVTDPKTGVTEHPQDHGHRQGRRRDRRADAGPREPRARSSA